MAMEPINLFARIADPAGVARRLRELAPGVEIDGPDDDWRNAVVNLKEGDSESSLTFTHDPAYYSEPNWSAQMNGMRGYFARFPETDRKARVLMLPSTFRFSLATDFEPDLDPDGDARLNVLFAIAELVDGVLFTPSSLRDASGRILFGAGGEPDEDPDAVWPQVVAVVSVEDYLGSAMHEMSDEPPIEPPTPERVARRALALTAVTARAILEQDADDPEASESYQKLLKWVQSLEIDDEFESQEWELVHQPLGLLDPGQQIDATWKLEGLVVLAWALGRSPLPPHDQLVEVDPLWQGLGIHETEAAKSLLTSPTLRSHEEFETLRNRLFALHWRLRNFRLNPGVMDFAEFARTCWFGPLDLSDVPLIEGDLAIAGDRIDRAPEDLFSAVHSAAQERHQAVNWLREGPVQYSRASVAT